MLGKRLFDVAASALGLLVLSPVLLLTAVAIRLESRGSALFLQERVGYAGRPFRIIKFRTMRPSRSGDELQITVGADPRITRLGGFLRRTKIDELPQLMNVLRGEMSLVGPRPEVPFYMNMYTPEQRRLILSVRPGVTDFAAIEFSEESAILANSADPLGAYVDEIMPRKFVLYKRYINDRSFLVDLNIIIKTITKILK